MGIMDKVNDLKDKATGMAGEHADKVKEGADKAAEFAKEKTGGKYDDKIDAGNEKIQGMADRAGGDGSQ